MTSSGSISPPLSNLDKAASARASGDFQAALGYALEAFIEAPDEVRTQQSLVTILGTTSGYNLPRAVTDHLAAAALKNNLDIQALASVSASQMAASQEVPVVIEVLEATDPGTLVAGEVTAAFDAVLQDPLLHLVLDRSTAISSETEQLITALRPHALAERLQGHNPSTQLWAQYPEALAAIANQCFHTEYVFDGTMTEEALLQSLQMKIAEAPVVSPEDCLTLAMYKPLLQSVADMSDQLLARVDASVTHWPEWALRVWEEQAQNVYLEAVCRDALEAYTPVSPGLSMVIREQYEQFPYPRWQSAKETTTRTSLKAMLAQHQPHLVLPKLSDKPVNTLFAGCGTGRQVVEMSQSIAMDNVLAVDLSRTSLAHAQRQAHERGLTAFHFGQADILAIRDWDARFDFIVCTGVLHHMADPIKALSALVAVSKPETVFFLALYSERARTHVKAARQFIHENNIPGSIEGIRAFRHFARGFSKENPASRVCHSREFYSASGLHDLVFNQHELWFTPLQLKTLLDACGLSFGGFQIDREDHKTLYRTSFPDDPAMTNLANWDVLEQENPRLFPNMMQFWCVRKDT